MKSKSGTIPTSENLKNSINEKNESMKSTLGKTANSTRKNLRTEKRSNHSNARTTRKATQSQQNTERNLLNVIPEQDGVIGIRTNNVLILMNEVSDLQNAPEAAKSDIRVASRFLKIVYDEI